MLTILTVLTVCLAAAAVTYVLSSWLDRAYPTGRGFGVLGRHEETQP